MKNSPKTKLLRRHRRIRARVIGSPERPRLSVSRSSRFMRAQIIDDSRGVTIVSASDLKVKKGTKSERAAVIGSEIAKKAIEKGITTVTFDRGGAQYQGRVKILAEAAREAGLKF